MIDKAKVVSAIKEMTANNEDWRTVLKNAPGAANLRVALAFYASKNLDAMSSQEKDEYREFRETLEKQLNAEELKYLTEAFGHMGISAAQEHYADLFGKKTPDEQKQGSQAYEEIAKKLGWSSAGGDGAVSAEAVSEQTNGNGQEG